MLHKVSDVVYRRFNKHLTLTLTLIQSASKWMHWATLWCHSDLFWAATSASSRVIPILDKSLLTVLLQFAVARGRPGPLLNPGTSLCNACRGIRWWSIRIACPSQRSLLSLSMSSMLCCPVLTLTSSFVTLSLQEMPEMLFCLWWWASFNLFVSVAVSGHTSALHRRFDRTIASNNLIFTFRLIHLFFHIFLIFQTLLLLSRCELWRPFRNCHYATCSYQGSRSHQLSRCLSL